MEEANYLNELKEKSQHTIENLVENYSLIRTTGNHQEFLNGLKIEYFGEWIPLQQLASIKKESSTTLIVKPYDKETKFEISKVISKEKMDFSVIDLGDSLKLVSPTITEEVRNDLVKKTSEYTEHARISIRNIRHDLLNKAKRENMSEDSLNNLKISFKEEVDKLNSKIEELFKSKKNKLLTI